MAQSYFPFQPEDLQRVLSAALSRGGDYADIFLEDTVIRSIELQDGMVSQAVQTVLYGAGIRVLRVEQTGYAYTMDLTMPAMLRAAQYAASIGQYGAHSALPLPVQTSRGTSTASTRQESLSLPVPEVMLPQQVRDTLMHIDQTAHEQDPRIVRVKASLNQRETGSNPVTVFSYT